MSQEAEQGHRGAAQGGRHDGPLSSPRRLKEVFDQAFKETEQFKDEFVSTEHLLLALARKTNDAAGRILASDWASPTTPFCRRWWRCGARSA